MRLQDIPTQKTEPGIADAQEFGEISFQLDSLDTYLYGLMDELTQLQSVLLPVLRDSYPGPGEEDEKTTTLESAMGVRLYGMTTMLRAQVERVQELRGRVML